MRYRMRYCICCMQQMQWKLIRYDCLNVWKLLGISPVGLKISLTFFFTPFASRFFVRTVFFCFCTKEKWEGGLRRQSDVFLHDIRKRIFCKNYFSCFRTKKKWEGGLKWQSEVFLPGGTFFTVVLLCQFLVLAGNRFWFYILMYLEYIQYSCGVVLVFGSGGK